MSCSESLLGAYTIAPQPLQKGCGQGTRVQQAWRPPLLAAQRQVNSTLPQAVSSPCMMAHQHPQTKVSTWRHLQSRRGWQRGSSPHLLQLSCPLQQPLPAAAQPLAAAAAARDKERQDAVQAACSSWCLGTTMTASTAAGQAASAKSARLQCAGLHPCQHT